MRISLAVLSFFLSAQSFGIDAQPEKVLYGPKYIHVDQRPISDLEFDVCYARVKFSNDTVANGLCNPVEEDELHCPVFTGPNSCIMDPKHNNNSGRDAELDPTTNSSSDKVEFGGHTWSLVPETIALLKHKSKKGNGGVCSCVLRSDDGEALEKVLIFKPVLRKDDDGKSKAYCPRPKEAYDLRIEPKDPKKIGDAQTRWHSERRGDSEIVLGPQSPANVHGVTQ